MTAEEKAFVKWWEENRVKEKKVIRQLMIGLPIGFAFGFPVLLSVLFRGWYKNMPYISGTQLIVVITAMVLIIVFYAIFRMHFRWDMNEQRYNELRSATDKEAAISDEEKSL
ncbi:MAG: hypothetical protein QM725_07925 [Lacibacter sp.]